MIRLLLDCDPGLDDAVALALLMASPELELMAVSTVAANAPIDIVTENADGSCTALLSLPALSGSRPADGHRAGIRSTSGAATADLPLRRCGGAAQSHPSGRRFAEARRAADCRLRHRLADQYRRSHRGRRAHPKRLVIMGGALGRGNATTSCRAQYLGRSACGRSRLRFGHTDHACAARHHPRASSCPRT